MSLGSLIILSIVQGVTEFIPVSSSGHLVIMKEILNFTEHGLEMVLWLHFATLCAVLLYFSKDLFGLIRDLFIRRPDSIDSNWVPLIILSSAITALIGVTGRNLFMEAFVSARFALGALSVMGFVLLLSRWSQAKRHRLTWKDAVWFGLAQGIAILPGLSRSGLTISSLLFLGVNREAAFRYSFLASIPVIAGAFLFERRFGSFDAFTPATLAVSFLVTFLCGLGSLVVLKRFVVHSRFYLFGFYCILLGLLGLFLV